MKLKIVDVFRFVNSFVRDLLDPSRLVAPENKRNYVKRLLAMVLPKFDGPDGPGTAGRAQIVALFLLAVVRTWLMNRSVRTLYLRTFAHHPALLRFLFKLRAPPHTPHTTPHRISAVAAFITRCFAPNAPEVRGRRAAASRA